MGISPRFVFNVDEFGCSSHIDGHEATIVVPIDYPDPSVPVPVNRHTKRSALTACIAADGCWMKPFVIADRATVEAEGDSTDTTARMCSSPHKRILS
jgi:hypothetical protein